MTENQRKWAIEEIKTNILPDACDEVAERALGYAIEALSQPERPKGRYVPDQNYRTLGNCSLCNADLTFLDKFCKNCGADMQDHIPEVTKMVEDGEEE